MLDRLFTIVSAVSIVPCVVTSVLWVRTPEHDVLSDFGPRGFEPTS